MTLKQLLARRDELLVFCAGIDRQAGAHRERDEPLPVTVLLGFVAHTELRVCERLIAKMREPRR
jgi:hypothetical protein